MDWTTPLRSLQADFIQRLKSGHLLHSELAGTHSELTVVSGERLNELRNFCWEMVDKYKNKSRLHPKDIFINNMKGKLGEEVVKVRLGNLVTEVDYEKRIGGDGKVDFTLASDPSVGIQVKARYGDINSVQWSVNQAEVEKNVVLVCVLIQEEVNEAQTEYHLILAGFLPTDMIEVTTKKAYLGIDELLYGGAIKSYIWNPSNSISVAKQYIETGEYKKAVEYCDQVLQTDSHSTIAYFSRGVAYAETGNYQAAIEDFTQTTQFDPSYAAGFYRRGVVYTEIGDYQKAIVDYTKAIEINPDYASAYYHRGLVHAKMGNEQEATANYIEAININPVLPKCFFDKAEVYEERGAYRKARDAYQKAADLFVYIGNEKEIKQTEEKIQNTNMMIMLKEGLELSIDF